MRFCILGAGLNTNHKVLHNEEQNFKCDRENTSPTLISSSWNLAWVLMFLLVLPH